MSHALLASLHYLGAMVLMACLVAEHLLISSEMDRRTVGLLARIDLVYGITAGLQIGSGLLRLFAEKGSAFYLHSPFFHIKMTVFVLLGLLSIYPTLRFLAWRRAASSAERIRPTEGKRVLMLVRVELLLLIALPVLASLMARGLG
ncbi:DUF2214 family protein [Chitinimonas sp.]|uniref:DUF2214 family protein n=1 Tax=Chitinimonas sp. TaxID=1934313 RepID=UPI0035B1DDA3